MLLVPHVRDPSTGHLVHVGHSHHPHRGAFSSLSTGVESVGAADPEGADEDDAECLVAVQERLQYVGVVLTDLVSATPAPEPALASFEFGIPGAGLPIHRLAPKQSPPA